MQPDTRIRRKNGRNGREGTPRYADQRAHDVAMMTAAEREAYGARLAALDAMLAGRARRLVTTGGQS